MVQIWPESATMLGEKYQRGSTRDPEWPYFVKRKRLPEYPDSTVGFREWQHTTDKHPSALYSIPDSK